MLAPENSSEINGRVVIGIGDEVRTLDYSDALELADAIFEQAVVIIEANAKCGGCQAPVKWVKTLNKKNTPIDPAPQTIVTLDGRYVVGFTSHFASCPNAKEFRRSKRKKK